VSAKSLTSKGGSPATTGRAVSRRTLDSDSAELDLGRIDEPATVDLVVFA